MIELDTIRIRKQEESVQFIRERDPVMNKLIEVIGDLEITLRTDYVSSLVRSIIGQQISVTAATAIYGRLQVLLEGAITAEALLETSDDELGQVGLTKRKIQYVKDLAGKVVTRELDLENLFTYENQEIIDQLTNVKGIGNWTAEMFLLLSLGRMDVLAVDDVGIQRGAKWLYEVDKSERRNILIQKSSIWQPYRSVVSFYLWEAVHLEYVTDYESVAELISSKNF